MIKLPLKRLIKFTVVFLFWMPASFLTLLSAFYLLLLPALSAQASTLETIFDPARAYHLFRTQPQNGQVLGENITSLDARVEILKSYLRDYRSPLEDSAKELVLTADKYQLPWTLLPAIAGKESGFGKVIPYGSYNAWGWGVYTGQVTGANFSSWEGAIEKVAAGIRKDYFDKGLDTVEEMEPYYTPSSLDRGNTWRDGVNYFIWEIENYSNYQ